MNYKIQDIEKSFEGKIIENLGNNDYVIKINDNEHKLKIITMNSKGIEFILDQKYHKAKYLEQSTNEMNIVIDNVPITLSTYILILMKLFTKILVVPVVLMHN